MQKKNRYALTIALVLLSTTIGKADTVPAAPAAGTTTSQTTHKVWADKLNGPQGMARDAAGNLYVAEYGTGQIAKFSADGTLQSRIGSLKEMRGATWIVRSGDELYVADRRGNRLLKLNKDDSVTPVGVTIEQPLGLAVAPDGRLLIVLHTTSKLLAKAPNSEEFVTLFQPDSTAQKYGLRCVLAQADGTLLMTDESEGKIWRIKPNQAAEVWIKDLAGPTAIVTAPDGSIVVAEENSGRLLRLDAQGKSTVIAEGLGQARDVEFLSDKIALVSDRKNGTIWQVTLP